MLIEHTYLSSIPSAAFTAKCSLWAMQCTQSMPGAVAVPLPISVVKVHLQERNHNTVDEYIVNGLTSSTMVQPGINQAFSKRTTQQ